MDIQLSDHFTCARLIRFTLPSMGMLIIATLYSIVDGFFISNFVGKTAFVGINLIFPFIAIPGTLGFMVGTGGSALVSKLLGEGDSEKANSVFSLLIYASAITGLALTLGCLPLIRPVAEALGAEGEVLEAAVLYGWWLVPGLTPMILQFMFQSFFSLAENPRLGLLVTLAAGVVNVVFDVLFIIVFGWGLSGAAAATLLGLLTGTVLPLAYFGRPNQSRLRIGRTRLDWQALLKACTNGSSELMSNVSMSIVAMLFNFQLMRLAGENGVAAYGVIMYVTYIFSSVFLGYAFGSIPIIGYHFGAHNVPELRGLFRRSVGINAVFGILLTGAAVALARPLAEIFVGYDEELLAMTEHAFVLYSLSFLLAGLNIFASSLFTALNNGLISALISFLRTLLFQVVAVLALPLFLGIDGIWLAVLTAEVGAFIVTAFCIRVMRRVYGYM